MTNLETRASSLQVYKAAGANMNYLCGGGIAKRSFCVLYPVDKSEGGEGMMMSMALLTSRILPQCNHRISNIII